MAELILTSKLGRFTFDGDVLLSRAKLLRDSITGQFFNFNHGHGRRIVDERSAQEFASESLGRDLQFGFDLDIASEHAYRQ